MAKRRTAGIQRRQRASTEALNRRIESSARAGLPLDWRILLIGGVLLVGAIILVVVVVVVLGAGPNPYAGTRQTSATSGHVQAGTDVRASDAGAYTSTPATVGPHWDSPANWGVYSVPQSESQVIHNLEHGGIVIWYQPDRVSDDDIARLTDLVEGQIAEGVGGQFKFILSPWGGEDFGSPIAVTSWEWLLYLETADLDAINGFVDAHYGDAPEPGGGPGP